MKSLILLLCLAIPCSLFASEAITDSETTTTALSVVATFITAAAVKYPIITTIFAVIGVLRTIFKPIMSAIQSYVLSTPSAEDDTKLAAIQSSRWYRILAYLLDWTASIKIPVVK